MEFFARVVEVAPTILTLVMIEGLLSVDNALAIAAMAAHLPVEQQRLALRLGLLGAYGFRGLALFAAGWIISNQWIKAFGALYLVYLMCSHLTASKEDEAELAALKRRGLLMMVLQIELMDLSLSVDNVVAAVILSPNLWVVCAGVFIGILVLRFLAGFCIRLLKRFPILAQAAFVLVGMVGGILFFEMGTGIHLGHFGKFCVIVGTLGASFAYGQFRVLRRSLDPLLRPLVVGMGWFAWVCESVFWPLKVLHRQLTQLFRRRRIAVDETTAATKLAESEGPGADV